MVPVALTKIAQSGVSLAHNSFLIASKEACTSSTALLIKVETFWRIGSGNTGIITLILMLLLHFQSLLSLEEDYSKKVRLHFRQWIEEQPLDDLAWTRNKLQKILTPLSREKPRLPPRKELVKCPKCGSTMELIGVTRPS